MQGRNMRAKDRDRMAKYQMPNGSRKTTKNNKGDEGDARLWQKRNNWKSSKLWEIALVSLISLTISQR